MRIIVEDEAAVERVRRARGDKSPTETVKGLIAEADARPAAGKDAAHTLRPYAAPKKRKGARS